MISFYFPVCTVFPGHWQHGQPSVQPFEYARYVPEDCKFLASLILPIRLSGQNSLFETEIGIFSSDNRLKSIATKIGSFRIVKQLSVTYTDGSYFVDIMYKET
jgi:hypothetical protein